MKLDSVIPVYWLQKRRHYKIYIMTASVDTSLFLVIIHVLDAPFEEGIKRVKLLNGAVMSNTLNYIPVVKNWIPLE